MDRTTSWTNARARVAALTRSRPANDPDLIEARRALRATRAEDYIRQVINDAPPLTTEQVERLRQLLPPPTPQRIADALASQEAPDAA